MTTDKLVSYTDTANHWDWRAMISLDCQIGTVITMPEDGMITSVEFMVGGLNYNDPVYGYQYHNGYVRPAVWRASDGTVLTVGSYTTLSPQSGGGSAWQSFNLNDVQVHNGDQLIVGFWRNSSSTSYATQWNKATDLSTDSSPVLSASGCQTLGHDVWGSESGPLTFRITNTYNNTSLNYRLHYTAGGRVKVWDGRYWRQESVSVWNGTAWVPGTVNVWNGTAWVESTE